MTITLSMFGIQEKTARSCEVNQFNGSRGPHQSFPSLFECVEAESSERWVDLSYLFNVFAVAAFIAVLVVAQCL